MDQNYIEQNDIARKYMQGRLTPEEAADFEVYLMDKPELVEEMELDGLFDKHVDKTETAKNNSKHFFFNWLSIDLMKYAFVMAVAFILGTLVDKDQVSGGSNIYYLSNMRGDTEIYAEKIRLNEKHSYFIFVLQPEIQEHKEQTIKLKLSESEGDFEEVVNIFPNESGDLVIPITMKKLKPGKLRISHLLDSDKIGDEFDILVEN